MWEALERAPRTTDSTRASRHPCMLGCGACHLRRSAGAVAGARHLGCGRAICDARRCCALLAVAVLAGGCGASLGGRYDSATTAPGTGAPAGATASVLRVVTAQPLPSLDPAFANTRQSRAVANALCTPLVRYADAEGLPGTVIVPGLARDLPIVSRGSRTFRIQLLAGLHFADGRRLTTAGRARDLRAPARSGHRLARGRALPRHRRRADVRRRRGSAPARRARQRRADHVHAQALGSGVPGAPGDADRLPRREQHAPPRGARPAGARGDGSLPRRRELVLADRPPARDAGGRASTTAAALGAAARISIERLDDAGALEAAIRSGDADLSLDDLPGAASPALAIPSTALAVLRIDPSRWPLSDESVRRALSLALDRRALAQADGGDVVAARSLLLDPQAPGALPADPATARALLRRAGAEGTLRLALWAEPGAQARVARAIADQLAQIGVQVDVHVASAAERPSGARAWIEWLDPAYGDPAAIFMPLADALSAADGPRRPRASRSASGVPHGSPAMRAGPPSGASTSASAQADLGAIPLLRANFSTPISSMLVGRGTHPVFDVDLALLSTRP